MSRNWQIKKLSEICNLITDGVHNSPKYIDSGIPMLDAKHIKDDFSIDDQNPTKFISQETDNLLSKRCKPLANDLLISSRGSIGKIAIVKEGQNFNIMGNIILLRVPNDVISKYVAFSLQSKLDEIQSISRGVAQKGLYLNQVRNFEIPIPPLPEQKRIVAILDEAFEGIDRAISNTEKNLSNARELFESYLNSIFSQKGEGWEEKKLGDIATFRNGLNFTKSSKGESIKIVGVKDFQNHFWIQEDQLESVTIDAELKEIDILRKGDILTVRSNGNKELIGRCVLAGDIYEKTSHSGFTIRIRIEREDIYPQFIVHYLKSKQLRKQLTESGGGISISSLNQQGLSLIKLSFPIFTKQKAIVANIDELAIETQHLETIYRQKIAALKELKQSILQKAFTGELTADKGEK